MKDFFSRNPWMLLVVIYLSLAKAVAQVAPAARPLALDYAAPASYLIEDIRILGATSLDDEFIVSILGIKPGDTVQMPGPAISDAIQRLWKQRLVKDVAIYASQVADHRVVLTVRMIESPRLSDYSFEGVDGREREKLMEKLTLVKGKIVTDELIKKARSTIQDYWLEEGYPAVKTTITSSPDPMLPDHVRLSIKVDKGNQPSLNTIHFEGNHHVSSDVLKSQMRHIREKPRFTLVKDILEQIVTLRPIRKGGVLWRPISFKDTRDYVQRHVILSSSKWSQSKFEEDKRRIISYYQIQGFQDVAIVEKTVSKHEDHLLDVYMTVEEGTRYRVGDIRWVGNHLYGDDVLSQLFNVKKGDVYDPSLLQQRLFNDPTGEDIASLYMDRGHAFFRADLVEKGLREDVVDLDICIHEGAPTCINKVLIEGNTLSHDYVIRRELKTLPGDRFNRAKVERSHRELARLNLFSPAIEILNIPNHSAKTLDLKYKVEDKPRFEINFSGSWSNSGVAGAVILATNNFSLGNLFRFRVPMGDGQTLGIRSEVYKKEGKNLSLQFTSPWIGVSKPTYSHFSLQKEESYDKEKGSMGANVSLGTRFAWPDDYTFCMGGLSYHRHNYKDYHLLDNGQKCTGVLDDLSVSISLKRDSTGPGFLYPKEGSMLALRTSFTPPWSLLFNEECDGSYALGQSHWKEYHQWMVDGSYFLTLIEDLVFNVRAHFGVLGKFPSQRRIGPFERFSVGGVNSLKRTVIGKEYISLRGYEEDYIMPEDEVSRYKGGVIYDKFVLELRYPVISSYFVSAYAVAFAEGGNTWAGYEDFAPFDLKRSKGVGLRLNLPTLLGATVGFDWAQGLDRISTDKEGGKLKFHFSLGLDVR